MVSEEISSYMRQLGARGGRTSKRKLDPETARQMVRVREARRAYREFHARCFWSSPPDLLITAERIEWVVNGLRKNGGRAGWERALRLCR